MGPRRPWAPALHKNNCEGLGCQLSWRAHCSASGIVAATPIPESTCRTTILIVDDEPVMRETITAILKTRPWRVLTAASDRDAFALLERHNVDVVILDIDLTGSELDGVGMLERIRARGNRI